MAFLGKLFLADILILGVAFVIFKITNLYYRKYWKPDFVKTMMIMMVNAIVVMNVMVILFYVLQK